MANICVFASSVRKVKDLFYETARTLGVYIAQGGHSLVYGGSDRGLMGAVALSALDRGGKIVEVIPEIFQDVALKQGELIVTKDFRDRKKIMWDRSDAFIALPGGFGTLDEIADTIATNLLANEQGNPIKPLVMMNIRGFYDKFLDFLETIYKENLAPQDNRQIYSVAESCGTALDRIEKFIQPQLGSRVAYIEGR